MAEILENHHFSKGKRGNPQYKYDEWFDGQIWKIKKYNSLHGQHACDFDCNVSSMRTNLYNAARSRGIEIRTEIGPDYVIVQRID